MTTWLDSFITRNNLDQYLTKDRFNYVVYFLGLILGLYLNWDLSQIALLVFLFWLLFNPVPSRFLANMALFFLAVTPVLLAINRQERAEAAATAAYLFLLLTMIRAVIEYRQEKKMKP